MAVILWLLQAPPACPAPERSGAQCVYLAPEQMAALAEQAQANTAFICGYLGFAIIALAGIFWRSTL